MCLVGRSCLKSSGGSRCPLSGRGAAEAMSAKRDHKNVPEADINKYIL
jgi:hypothetical protein